MLCETRSAIVRLANRHADATVGFLCKVQFGAGWHLVHVDVGNHLRQIMHRDWDFEYVFVDFLKARVHGVVVCLENAVFLEHIAHLRRDYDVYIL